MTRCFRVVDLTYEPQYLFSFFVLSNICQCGAVGIDDEIGTRSSTIIRRPGLPRQLRTVRPNVDDTSSSCALDVPTKGFRLLCTALTHACIHSQFNDGVATCVSRPTINSNLGSNKPVHGISRDLTSESANSLLQTWHDQPMHRRNVSSRIMGS